MTVIAQTESRGDRFGCTSMIKCQTCQIHADIIPQPSVLWQTESGCESVRTRDVVRAAARTRPHGKARRLIQRAIDGELGVIAIGTVLIRETRLGRDQNVLRSTLRALRHVPCVRTEVARSVPSSRTTPPSLREGFCTTCA